MKKTIFTLISIISISCAMAQSDSTATTKTDTSKKNSVTLSIGTDKLVDIKIGNKAKKKRSNVTTDWFIFDLGFANFRDQTNYATAQGGSYFHNTNGVVNANSLSLINGKSSNVNIWFFMQKMNLVKHKLNLKYGLGLEMYNYRYEHSVSFRNEPTNYVFNDSIHFSKNKLYAEYLTVPFMVNFTPDLSNKNSLCFSAGVSAGYLISSRNKQISDERGKQKISGNFDLEPFRLAIVGEIGLGGVRLYGSYSLNTFHKESTGLQQYPYALGIRFSRL